MPESYPTEPAKQTPFVVTTYRADAQGHLTPDVPDQCPVAVTSGDPEPCCRIKIEHKRDRKCGPGHPLWVVGCGVHGIAFTLYPPGFAPYRRQSVAAVGPDGAQIGTNERTVLKKRFSGTLFDAALDAAEGVAWARESGDSLPERWWSTQGRHLKLLAQILGIASGFDDRTQEAVARILNIEMIVLCELRPKPNDVPRGYRAYGKAIGSILAGLRGAASAAITLLRSGHWIGCWGEPLHWDSKRRLYDRGAFPVSRTLPSP